MINALMACVRGLGWHGITSRLGYAGRSSRGPGGAMGRAIFFADLRVLATCLLFAVCSVAGGALSGIDKIAQQTAASQPTASYTTASQPTAPGDQQVPAQKPENFLGNFLILTLCAGGTLSYLILRSRWHGWVLAGAIFVSMYGSATVGSQVETVAFLSDKLPPGMIRAIFVQGAIAAALFAPLAVLVLGKWRGASLGAASVRAGSFGVWVARSPAAQRKPGAMLLRVAILVAAFVFLYMFFGYYVAWRNPELRSFYGGPEHASFWEAWKYNWASSPWIYALAALCALLYIACLYPIVRMLHASRWESALAAALFLTCWTTILLLPNPLMPASVARSHFWETLGFSLVFGALAGWLLCVTVPALAVERT